MGLAGGSTYNTEVYANWIGVTELGGRTPNSEAGVALWGGAHDNLIRDVNKSFRDVLDQFSHPRHLEPP